MKQVLFIRVELAKKNPPDSFAVASNGSYTSPKR
jgi:hypothetical protein